MEKTMRISKSRMLALHGANLALRAFFSDKSVYLDEADLSVNNLRKEGKPEKVIEIKGTVYYEGFTESVELAVCLRIGADAVWRLTKALLFLENTKPFFTEFVFEGLDAGQPIPRSF